MPDEQPQLTAAQLKQPRRRRPPKPPEQRYRVVSVSLHPFDFAKLERLAMSRFLNLSQTVGVLISQQPEPFPDSQPNKSMGTA